jgi:hypothetical protein
MQEEEGKQRAVVAGIEGHFRLAVSSLSRDLGETRNDVL